MRIVDLGVTRYDWIPGVTGLTTPSAPSLADLTATAALNISQFTVTTTDINPDASDTVNERAVTDTSNAVVPTVGNYHGNLVVFRDYTAGVPTTDVDLAAVFTKGQFGWITRRLGKPASAALAVGDQLDVFLFMVDSPSKTGGTGEGYLKLNVPLLQQGQYYPDAVTVS